jgi:hypothetical protein
MDRRPLGEIAMEQTHDATAPPLGEQCHSHHGVFTAIILQFSGRSESILRSASGTRCLKTGYGLAEATFQAGNTGGVRLASHSGRC